MSDHDIKRNKKRVLVLSYTYTLSHLSRPLAIAKELRARGVEVVFAGESPKTKFISEEGFDVLPVFEPHPERLFGNIRKGKIRFASNADIHNMITADLSLFKHVRPDVVLTDGRFSALISTQITGLNHVAIVNGSSTAYRALPYFPIFEALPLFKRVKNKRLNYLLDLVNLKMEFWAFDNIMNIYKRLSKRYSLEKEVTATNCLTGKDITLLVDVPEYFPSKNLPSNYHYIGPITWKRNSNAPPPGWWPPKKRGKYLIYITMGTTGLPSFFKVLGSLFSSSGMVAVITTGGQVDPMPNIPGKVYIEDFMDGDLIMKNCDLVVCHGGNGTIYQALRHAKPIVGISTLPDQAFNMRRVEALGLGMSVESEKFNKNPKILVDTVRKVFYRKSFFENNAKRMQEILKTYRGEKAGADIIEQYCLR